MSEFKHSARDTFFEGKVNGLPNESGDKAIVSSILSLAFATGKHVIAEGIERADQAVMLRGLGCHVGQGYLFSKPIEASGIMGMFRAPPWQNTMDWGYQLPPVPADSEERRGHGTFIEEFLEHIGVPIQHDGGANRP